MAEEERVDKELQDLERELKKFEEARLRMEKTLAEKKTKLAEVIPKLQAKLAEQDKIIVEANAERARIMQQLKLLGFSVKGAKAGVGKREGGKYDKMREMIMGVGIGGSITNAEIQDFLESSSGYVGMIVKDAIDKGWLKRTQPGTYEVIGIPA